MIQRNQLTDTELLNVLEILTNRMGVRISEKGKGAYASNHEALGIITEEYYELVEAVQLNNSLRVAEEMLDIAVGCVIAIASQINSGNLVAGAQNQAVEEATTHPAAL